MRNSIGRGLCYRGAQDGDNRRIVLVIVVRGKVGAAPKMVVIWYHSFINRIQEFFFCIVLLDLFYQSEESCRLFSYCFGTELIC